MWRHSSRFDVGQAASDAFDDRKLALDIVRDGLAGEEGFRPARVLGQCFQRP